MKKILDTPEKQKRFARFLYIFVLLSFILPIVYIVIKMIFGNIEESEAGYHSYADYLLMIVECVLGLLVINLPTMLAKRLKFELPVVLYIFYIIFLYCAIFLGEVRSFYYVIPHWDVFLHAFSSIMTGFFGFMAVTILNRNERIVVKLSPFFVAWFAFSFGVTIGSVWEVYEFAADEFLGLNMQKFMTANGTVLSGHAALYDTMKDIIVDMCGAGLSSMIGYFAIKNDRHWFSAFLTKDKTDNQTKKKKIPKS